MRVVVVGAGLGGLGLALRLQGAGHDVVVVEQRERPGGRAYQLQDAGFTWDTGPSLITMPWVLEEGFAAGGLQDGVDVAKCLALGACAAGIARPLLVAAQAGKASEALGVVIEQLRIAVWACGAASASSLSGEHIAS